MQNIETPNAPLAPQQNRNKKVLRVLIEFGQYLLIGLLFYAAGDALIGRARVGKQSMEPTFYAGDVLVVNRLAYRFGQPKRGEVITFHYPLDTSVDYIKRVIGLPGDRVEIKEQKLFINAVEIQEPYVVYPSASEGVWDVPAESLFVMGDNREVSADSRSWGFVPLQDVIGKVVAQYWPIHRIRLIFTPPVFEAAGLT